MPGQLFHAGDSSDDARGDDDWLRSAESGSDSVVEVVEGSRPPGSKSKQPTHKDSAYYAQRLRDKDAQLNEANAKMRALKREMAMMTVKDGPAPKKSQSKKARGSPSTRQSGEDSDTLDHNPEQDIDTESRDGEMKRLRQLGGKFAIMYMLWLGNTRAAFRTKPDPEYDPMERFNGDLKWKRQGELTDLLEVLPEEYHNRFTGNIFSIFDEGMKAERSNSASRIRLRLGPRIFDASPDSFQDPAWRYDKYRVLAGWTEDANGQAYYTPFAPILYLDYQGRPDINNAFLNPALFKIFNVIIRGPNALDRTEPRGKSTQDTIWGLTEVTPGAIAASATFARYAISKDQMLQRQGAMTNIDYEADFNTYLRYLTSGLANKKRSVMRIFTKWNQYFFPSKAGLNVTTAAAPDRAIDAVFAELDDEMDSDRDPNDHSQLPSPTRSTISHSSSLVVHANVDAGQGLEDDNVMATSANNRPESSEATISELETTSSLKTTTTVTRTRQRAPPAPPAADPNRRSLRSRVHAPAAWTVNNAVTATNEPDHLNQDDEESANATGKGKGPGSRQRKRKARA